MIVGLLPVDPNVSLWDDIPLEMTCILGDEYAQRTGVNSSAIFFQIVSQGGLWRNVSSADVQVVQLHVHTHIHTRIVYNKLLLN